MPFDDGGGEIFSARSWQRPGSIEVPPCIGRVFEKHDGGNFVMRWSRFHSSKHLATLASLLPQRRLHPAVLAYAEGRRKPEIWAVAFSGGADSLALLLLLWAYWPERRKQLLALHFNHRLRGRAAKADEVFCRRVCAGLGVRLKVGQWRNPPKQASEAEARIERFRFFEKELRAAHGKILWFGHQQDDIAETMLMRLARGSGSSGLAAPRPVQEIDGLRVHLRPLLTLKKSEIVDALLAARISWREDATNHGDAFLRNRTRHSVVPAWQKSAGDRDVLSGAALSRELVEEDDAALEGWLDSLLKKKIPRVLPLAELRGKPRAILRRALRRWLLAQPKAGELSRAAFVTLLAALEQGKPTRQSLGKNGFAVLTRDHLKFQLVAAEKNLESNSAHSKALQLTYPSTSTNFSLQSKPSKHPSKCPNPTTNPSAGLL